MKRRGALAALDPPTHAGGQHGQLQPVRESPDAWTQLTANNGKGNSMNKQMRDATKMAEQAGLTVIDARISGGCHIRLKCRKSSGEERLFFAPSSPSDYRWQRKKLAEMRRWARA